MSRGRRGGKGAVNTKAANVQGVRARYDAAGNGRRMAKWNPGSSGPNKTLQGLQNIRDRARDTTRNDWSGSSGVQKWATNLVGIGIIPRFKRLTSKPRKQVITDLWSDFVETSDADGVLNVYGQQTLGVRTWVDAGEAFARRRYRRLSDGLAVPMQVQMLDPEFVPMLDADSWPGMQIGNRIRSGIEFTPIGQRVAYWVWKYHPTDSQATNVQGMYQDLTRVPASDMIHVFEPIRPGQLRGVSLMAPVLARLRNIGDYDDAVLERQKLANLFVAFITRTMPTADTDIDIDPLTNLPIDYSSGEPLAGMHPGLTQELDPGQDVKFANPPEAGTTYSDYMRTQNMGTAAAAGIPYEIFSGDIANVSDRTLRVIIQEFRRLAEQRQWQIIIPMFCQKVVNWFAEAALLAGKINESELDAVKRCEHAPHGWQYIHPVQDPQGKKLEVDAGFRSRSSVIAERGDDPDAVDEERSADKKRETELDIAPVAPSAPGGAGAVPADPGKPAPPSALELAQIRMFNAQTVAATREPVAVEPAPAPVVNIVNQQPAVNVAAPAVNVEPAVVNVASPTVNVAAPAVTVEPTVVNVPAPIVNVENNVPPAEVNVHMPTRKSETTVQYDAKGNIINATQIESDLDEPQPTPQE